jgi:sugar lactone lactonase YvrE
MIRDGCILRYRPDGTLDRNIKAPTLLPTMICFGGHRLDQLYLTTSSHHYASDTHRAAEPLSGSIFRLNVGETGLREPLLKPF